MASKYLSGTYNAGYTLSGVYTAVTVGATASIGGTGLIGNANPDTVVNLGHIAATSAGAAGVSLQSGGSVSNGNTSDYTALIAGATGSGAVAGGASGGTGGTGGLGISLSGGGTIVTLGTIDGGAGGAGGSGSSQGGAGGGGGIGADVAGGGSINNNGLLSGGAGGSGSSGGAGAAGGDAILLAGGGTIVNSYTITGGVGGGGGQGANSGGGIGGDGAAGGVGIVLTGGGAVSNSRLLAGGTGGAGGSGFTGGAGGRGGDGADLSSGIQIINTGKVLGITSMVLGGAGGAGGSAVSGVGGSGGAGGVGIVLSGGTLTASGAIVGGVGGLGGNGQTGGPGGAGGAGIDLAAGGAVTNTRLIAGGAGGNSPLGSLGSRGSNGPGGAGIIVSNGGSIYNTGMILGGAGGSSGGIPAPTGTGIILLAGGTVTNAATSQLYGTISGAVGIQAYGTTGATVVNYADIYANGPSGTAVGFANPNSLLVMGGRSHLYGKAMGGGGTLELVASAGVEGHFSGLGSHYTGFAHYTVLSGGWLLSGTNTVGSGATLTNSGYLQVAGQLTVTSGGLVNGGAISSGGQLTVESGAIVNGVDVRGGGHEVVSSGGLKSGGVISGFYYIPVHGYSSIGIPAVEVVLGTANNTVVGRLGNQTVGSANAGSAFNGVASGAILGGGTQDVFGSAVRTTIDSGGRQVVEGQIVSHGQTLQSNGIATDTVVYNGGTQVVYGVASGGVVSGGRQQVESGGVSSDTTIASNGTLELAAGGGLAGAVTFSGSGGTLQIDGTTLPINTISGVMPGDTIDLEGIAFNNTASVKLAAGNVLQVNENGTLHSLNLDPAQNFSGDSFQLSADAGGGTLISVSATVPLAFSLANFAVGAGGWTSQDTYPRALGDVNGDGLSDIVGFGSDGVYVSLATGGGKFSNPTLASASFGTNNGWTSQDLYPRELADVTGNGRADIVSFASDGVYVSLANGDGTFVDPILASSYFGADAGWTSQDQYPRELADVTGNGRADIVAFASDGVYVSLANSDGTFAAPILASSAFGTEPDGWTSQNLYPRELADVNGDGKADVVGFGANGQYVALSNGDGTFAAPVFASPLKGASNDLYPRELADVNGDGKADVVGFASDGVFTELGTNGGTFQPATFDFGDLGASTSAGGWTSQNTYPRLTGDVTGDGRADIVAFGSDGVYVAAAASIFHTT